MAKFLYSVLPPYTRDITDILFDYDITGTKIKALEGYLDSIDELVFDSLREYITSILTFTDIDRIKDEILPYLGFLLGYEWNPKLTTKYQRELLKNIVAFYKRKGTPYSLYYQLYAYDTGVVIYEPFKDIWILNKSILSGSSKNSQIKQKHYLPSHDYYSRGIFVVKTTYDPATIREVIETVRPAGTKALIEYLSNDAINLNPLCNKTYEKTFLPSIFPDVYFPFGINDIGLNFIPKTTNNTDIDTIFGFYADPLFTYITLMLSDYIPEDNNAYIIGKYTGALSSVKRLYNLLELQVISSAYVGTSILPTSPYKLTELYSFGYNDPFTATITDFKLEGQPLQWSEIIGMGNGTDQSFSATLKNKITSLDQAYIEITDGIETLIDDHDGNIVNSFNTVVGSINYITGNLSATFSSPVAGATTVICSLKHIDDNYLYLEEHEPSFVRVNGLLLEKTSNPVLTNDQWSWKYNSDLNFNTIYISVPHTFDMNNIHVKIREKLIILDNNENAWITDDIIPTEDFPITYVTYYYIYNVNKIYQNIDKRKDKNLLNSKYNRLGTTNKFNFNTIYKNYMHKDKSRIGTHYGFRTNDVNSKLGQRNWLEFDRLENHNKWRESYSVYAGKNIFLSSGVYYENIEQYTEEELSFIINCNICYHGKYNENIENSYKDVNFTSSFEITVIE